MNICLDRRVHFKKTIKNLGFFSPVIASQKILPEYLILIDRTTFEDQQAYFINSLIKQLTEHGIIFEKYYFDTTPSYCYTDNEQDALSLDRLIALFPSYSLLFFADSCNFVNSINGELNAFVKKLFAWSERLLFTLEVPEQWGYQEWLIAHKANFILIPVKRLIELDVTDIQATSSFPSLMHERPYRLLERHTLNKNLLKRGVAIFE